MASFTIPKRAMTAVALCGVIALMSCRGDPAGVIAPGENPELATAPETGNTQASQAEIDSVRTRVRKLVNRELRTIAARVQRTGRLSRPQFERLNALTRAARRSAPFQAGASGMLSSTAAGLEGITLVSPGGSIVEFAAATMTGEETAWLQQNMTWWIGTSTSTGASGNAIKIGLLTSWISDTKVISFNGSACHQAAASTVHEKDPFVLPPPDTHVSSDGPKEMGNCSPSGGSGGSCDDQIEFDPTTPCEPGSGGGGGGGGGGTCTEEWVIVEIWNDETGAWELLWEGNVLVCD